ncbi:MAG TPA: LLM class flavin-dependent oxidoreductase [Candidatus Dormibacteraeota bacterium]
MSSVVAPGLLLWSEPSTKEFLRLVALAEEAGYSELWYTDIRLETDAYINLALAAKQTKRLLLGPGVSDPYSRHPVLLAASMATLDQVSDGRAQVGIGTGSSLEKIGLVQDRPVRALREAIEIIRLLLSGQAAQYEGEIFRVSTGKLNFTPVRPMIPIFVASHSRQTLKLSGKIADGVLLANMGRRNAIDNAIAIIHEGEVEGERPAGSAKIHLRLEACISDDERSALDAMRGRLATRLTNTYPKWDHLEELGIEATQGLKDAASAKDSAAVGAQLSDADVRSSTLAGSVEQVTTHLLDLMAPEVTKVTIRPLTFKGQPLDSVITKFIGDVWPAVESSLTSQASAS